MRVLLISHWFPPIISGSSFYTQSLAQALQARGHEVVVVTLDWGEKYAPDSDLGFPVYCLPVVPIPKLPLFYHLKLMGFALTPQNHKRLSEIVKRHQIQVMHCTNHIFDTNFLATNVAQSSGIPMIGSITTPVQHQNPWMQRLYHLGDFSTIGWFGVRRWDGIVSLDQTVHEYVSRVYGREAKKKSVVIPFGVRLEQMASYENPLPKLSDRPQILMVGHIHPFRNPVQLVRAMPFILEKIPTARLILAGRTDLNEPLKTAKALGLNEEQVQFLGETQHAKTIELMKTSHVFASWVTGPYPSLGTAPMEAMLCGTPVVSDLPENLFGEGKLRDGENIVLVNSKDPKSIAHGIMNLLENGERRRKMGAAGRRFVLDHLGWDQIAAQMEAFYGRFVDHRRGEERSDETLLKCNS